MKHYVGFWLGHKIYIWHILENKATEEENMSLQQTLPVTVVGCVRFACTGHWEPPDQWHESGRSNAPGEHEARGTGKSNASVHTNFISFQQCQPTYKKPQLRRRKPRIITHA